MVVKRGFIQLFDDILSWQVKTKIKEQKLSGQNIFRERPTSVNTILFLPRPIATYVEGWEGVVHLCRAPYSFNRRLPVWCSRLGTASIQNINNANSGKVRGATGNTARSRHAGHSTVSIGFPLGHSAPYIPYSGMGERPS